MFWEANNGIFSYVWSILAIVAKARKNIFSGLLSGLYNLQGVVIDQQKVIDSLSA